MISAHLLAVYIAALFVVYAVPGPDMALVLQTSIGRGVRSGFAAAGGLGLARATHVTLSACGVAALLRSGVLICFQTGALQARRGTTNREYARVLDARVAWAPEFDELTLRFDLEWYGHESSTAAAYRDMADLVRRAELTPVQLEALARRERHWHRQ